ncbi:MAG: hypothetical protein KGK07_05005 [Chloroflexota bacterium]|nr:hypothetical protein [Chloroflexota bacterium]
MFDYAIGIAPEWYAATQHARTYEAEQHAWLRKLREIQKTERRRKRTGARTVIVSKPASLAGVHKMWF